MVLVSILKRKRMKIFLKDHFLESFFNFEEIMAPFSQTCCPQNNKRRENNSFHNNLTVCQGGQDSHGSSSLDPKSFQLPGQESSAKTICPVGQYMDFAVQAW